MEKEEQGVQARPNESLGRPRCVSVRCRPRCVRPLAITRRALVRIGTRLPLPPPPPLGARPPRRGNVLSAPCVVAIRVVAVVRAAVAAVAVVIVAVIAVVRAPRPRLVIGVFAVLVAARPARIVRRLAARVVRTVVYAAHCARSVSLIIVIERRRGG